jgi:hypothetical protein
MIHVQLQTLKLGGCAITDSSLQVVIKHCPELRLVEVSDSLRAPSLVQLPEACTVSKINTGKQSEAQNAGATTATKAETKAWNASSSIRTPQDSADGHAVPVIEEEATSPTAE